MSEELKLPQNFYDLLLEVSVVVGKQQVRIKDLAENVQVGSVLELNKLAGEACDIYVNNKKIAEGEIIIINEKYGVRITNVL